ncbi:MAG: NAD+ synthase [Candidatus Delongbacteria bacterium]|nr:NAD+ synthase [Candidatus Delongbacteria bacterium]MCG2759723.1 NAD+ synthase [Candidatus Delongbacteria bacterium]
MLKINEERTVERITEWMQKVFRKARFSKAVLGLSGGVDSAVVAYLAVRALGKENLTCIQLPYRTSSMGSITDADNIIGILGVKSELIDISPIVDVHALVLNTVSPARLGNIMARVRMTILFDKSSELESLVLGTSNKTERYLGYGTLYGDMASIVNPIGDLYKNQVWDIARYLKIPQEIIDKKPSADLIENQTDEKDFGFTYRQADDILDSIFDEKKSELETANLGYTLDQINEVLTRVKDNEYKGEVPYIFDLRAF